ncbi:hypothetical protein LG634_15280 [Streptomyces bambusae]|uniref:hypothetical protein n=1 Tax=Streptomyces bambusae TaxID=1550616 RepID=UPI001CFC7121|nr:hypothetical protein [Streptomyces bambusae]MCB5166190.1 hypothetical protein [Streptomyces bambusae]
MAITDDLRKTLADPTPLYFAAGSADLALQQARKVPALIDQLRAEAPARIDAVRNTDPKVVQDKAREAQAVVTAKVSEVLGTFDTDLKKLGEQAQDLALRSVGVAAEYAVRAKEAYDRVAEHGEQAVKQWRGEVAEEIVEVAVAVDGGDEPKSGPAGAQTQAAEPAAAEAKPARKAAPRKAAAKKDAAPAAAGDGSAAAEQG